MRIISILFAATLLFSAPAAGAGPQEKVAERMAGPVIKVVYNDIVFDEDLEGKWGFACVIEGMEKTILFNTGGDGDLLLKNMKKMDVDPRSIDMVVLSSEDEDYTGGLEQFHEKNKDAIIFAPASFSSKYREMVRKKKLRNVYVKGPMTLFNGAFTTGATDGEVPEQALVLKTGGGPVLIAGCATTGIVDLVNRVLSLATRQPFLVMGGFQMKGTDEASLRKTAEGLRELGVQYCGASHCTGSEAIDYLKAEYGANFVETGLGSVIEINSFKWKE